MSRLRLLATAFDYRPRLGGIATLGYELLRALARREEVEVRVLAPTYGNGDFSDWDQHARVTTTRVALPATATAAVAPLAWAIAREKRAFRPDAILNLLWQPEGIATLLSQASGRTPYFVYAHGVEIMESDASWKKILRKRLSPVKNTVFRGAARSFTNSAFTRELLARSCGLAPEKVLVAHPGFSEEEFFPLDRKPRELVEKFGLEGKKVFLTVSRLEDYKGIDRAIAAISRVREKHPEVVYLICGEGPDRKRLEAIVRHYRVGDCVRFAGKVPGERLRDYYALCDAFVLLSRENPEAPNVEGFGIVFIEAAACGKPSIAGLSGGISDAVGGDVSRCEHGWLVDPHDSRAAARAMLAVIENPEQAVAKGRAARARALGGFTWDQMASTILEGIRQGLRGPG